MSQVRGSPHIEPGGQCYGYLMVVTSIETGQPILVFGYGSLGNTPRVTDRRTSYLNRLNNQDEVLRCGGWACLRHSLRAAHLRREDQEAGRGEDERGAE